MNTHLNVFRTYAKENRLYQLENDLTRALAICLQEDSLFFRTVLSTLIDSRQLSELFNDIDSDNEISINIQKNSLQISEFEQIIAVSLSENKMGIDHFWEQKNEIVYDPICDIVISINNLTIIIETKRDNIDCSAQLYNQVFNVCKNQGIEAVDMSEMVIPKDLNWPLLMEIAVNVHSFEKATGIPNRFLKDFIDLVKYHNFRWLPELSIFSVSANNTKAIERRIESVINDLNKNGKFSRLDYNDRLGVHFDQPWAQEVLFNITENGDLSIEVYPGNTKAQGAHIFRGDPEFAKTIRIENTTYDVISCYHIKFTSFKKFFTGLWFEEDQLSRPLYTEQNFWKYCGRNKRDTDWDEIESLFNDGFKPTFDWKAACNWESKVLKSGKKQFDLSFGYGMSVKIPFKKLQEIDRDKSELSGLTQLIESSVNALKTIFKS